jgi:hypothetical protein
MIRNVRALHTFFAHFFFANLTRLHGSSSGTESAFHSSRDGDLYVAAQWNLAPRYFAVRVQEPSE